MSRPPRGEVATGQAAGGKDRGSDLECSALPLHPTPSSQDYCLGAILLLMKPTMSMTITLPTPDEAMFPTTEPPPAAAEPVTALRIAAPTPPPTTHGDGVADWT